MSARRSPRAWCALAALAPMACGPLTEDAPGEATPDCAIAASAVDPFKELLVVDEVVMSDRRASNAEAGELSFRHAAETLAGDGEDCARLIADWLETWAPPQLLCGWRRARVANGCDRSCEACIDTQIDLAQAPFRLIAVSNRVDLADTGGAAEGRLVFAATGGSGDAESSESLPMTIIFEYTLSGDRSVWAARWRALGRHAAFDEAYARDLGALVTEFVAPDTLAQVRVNDATRPGGAAMLEFHVERASAASRRRLAPAGLSRTPAHSLDGSNALRDYLAAHRADIVAERHELPHSLRAARVQLGHAWRLPGADADVRRAFIGNTCDGCHGQLQPTLDGGFHVAPTRRGRDRVSRFLFDPAADGGDELSRRAAVLSRLACQYPLVE